jgi:hypothetical protein
MPSASVNAMKRRSRADKEPINGRRRKTPEPERGNAPKGQARAKLSPATEETEVARLTRELSEERKQRYGYIRSLTPAKWITWRP